MDVGAWLRSLGLERHETAFRDNTIDMDVVRELTESDLAQLGLTLGDRKRLLRAIANLPPLEASSAAPIPPPPPSARDEAERRPITVMVAVAAVVVLAAFALLRTLKRDILPDLGLPAIYVAQPYGGMSPAQMEGFLTYYYEYHFFYINGIESIESQNIQGVSLMKLKFHPGTDMSAAMAETVSQVDRSKAFMPPGTVPPFIMRFDTGSVPVGYLVFSSESRSIGEIQDLALFRVRPMFASLPGVSAPPPFGGSQRSVVITVDPERLRAYDMTPDDIVNALAQGNAISPSGTLPLEGKFPFVPLNTVVRNASELEAIPLRNGPKWPV